MRRPFSIASIASIASSQSQHWPLAVADAVPPLRRRGRRIAAIGIGIAILLGSILPLGGLGWPVALRVAMGALGLVAIVWAALGRRPVVRASGAYIEANATGLARTTGDATTSILTWDMPFGVTLLASYGRPTALLAFTSPTQTRYVPARIDDRSEADDELLARIAVLADLDLVDGVAHDAALTAAAAAAIVRHVEDRDKDALGRLYLSDGKGMPITLDRANLALGGRTFDLTSRLEWRCLMFHESTGQAAALYQATWIRQAGSEVVLVAPMPASIVPREPNTLRGGGRPTEASGRLGRALTRDLRLLQAPAESPPARDTRVAIDRPFMMAVRRVLDDAPLAVRVMPEPSTPRQKLSAHS